MTPCWAGCNVPTTGGTISLSESPHLLLEASIVYLIHATAGKGLQILPALTAEEPHIAKVRCEVTQAFLEVGCVLWT